MTAAALPTAVFSSSATAWTPARPSARAWAVVAGIHAIALAGLLNAAPVVFEKLKPQPIEVSLIQARVPEPESKPLRPTRHVVPSAPQQAQALPLPEFVAVQPAVTVPVLSTPAPQVAAAQPQPQPSVTPTPPAPKPVAASALRYRVEPAVEVPRLSRRAGESGRVRVRVVFDAQGKPREAQVVHSSGFARLDAQAIEAMQASRIVPIVEDGRAIEVVGAVWVEYELD